MRVLEQENQKNKKVSDLDPLYSDILRAITLFKPIVPNISSKGS